MSHASASVNTLTLMAPVSQYSDHQIAVHVTRMCPEQGRTLQESVRKEVQEHTDENWNYFLFCKKIANELVQK